MDVTINIDSFSAEFPTLATSADSGVAQLTPDTPVTLTAVAGDPDAVAAIDGQTVNVVDVVDATSFTLDLDLSTNDVTDLAATGTFAVAPAPEPPPDGDNANHQVVSMSPGISCFYYPSPGCGGVPVDGIENAEPPPPPIPPEWVDEVRKSGDPLANWAPAIPAQEPEPAPAPAPENA
jgi:hypothetical protein